MGLSDLPFQAMGEQPVFEPGELERFVAAPRIGILAYVRRDGTPCQVPIWYAYEDGLLLMVTSTTSPKAKALARSPKVSLTIQDEMPPYRAVIVDGHARLSEAPVNGGITHALAVRYFGRFGAGEYEKMVAEENAKTGLTLITLEPARVRGFDNHRLVGAPMRAFLRLREALPIPKEWL